MWQPKSLPLTWGHAESVRDTVIEERPEHELVAMNGMRIAAPGIGT